LVQAPVAPALEEQALLGSDFSGRDLPWQLPERGLDRDSKQALVVAAGRASAATGRTPKRNKLGGCRAWF
jgi:hypothetical protein